MTDTCYEFIKMTEYYAMKLRDNFWMCMYKVSLVPSVLIFVYIVITTTVFLVKFISILKITQVGHVDCMGVL